MEAFVEILRRDNTLLKLSDSDKTVVAAIADKYPWFMTPKLLVCREKDEVERQLYLLSHPSPFLLQAEVGTDFTAEGVVSQENIIDNFIKRGEHKIVPKPDAPDFDASHESNILVLPDELITPEMAAIYRAQGLDGQAEEIERRLATIKESL